MKKYILLMLLTIGFLGGCSKSSDAGEYKLLSRPLLMKSTTPYAPYPKATDPSVCKAYEKNLNSFPDEIHPMSCNRRINTNIKGLEEIIWKEMDSNEAIKLLVPIKIKTSRNPVDSKERRTRLIKVLNDDVNAGIIKFNIASFDIDNDHNTETIVRESTHSTKTYTACVDGKYKENPGYYTYYIFTVSSGELVFDEKNSDHFYGGSGSAFNIFKYNNRIYLDTWKRDYIDPWQHKNKKAWFLKIYETKAAYAGIAKRLVCEYVFKK